ncbi:DUF2510 domain-containing protein [Streptomyces sp. NPDC091385]|uniref:DUF2510 domain-containing protein n=1 Tax=Streptomyces sp. NPDC091385 TaxID=3365997 RepID=UPI0038251053
MTQVTPPGWYPDPGQPHNAPPAERWWDGTAWTAQVRPAGHGTYPAPPAYPATAPYPPPPTPRRGLRIGIAVAAAVAVLASIGVGVYALAKDSGGGHDRAGAGQERRGRGGPEGSAPGDRGGPGDPGSSPSPRRSRIPKVKGGGTLPDPFNGISMPVPDGWTGEVISIGAQVTSDKSYKCPGNASQSCTAGGAYTASATALGTKGDTAEAVAKADIAANAKQSYGGTTYGSITSHEVLASKTVTVAGQKGYLVRWKAVTSKGSDGYVESVAFPSPNDAHEILVVRFGLDVGQRTTVIDEILKGIKVWSGGGSGQDV